MAEGDFTHSKAGFDPNGRRVIHPRAKRSLIIRFHFHIPRLRIPFQSHLDLPLELLFAFYTRSEFALISRPTIHLPVQRCVGVVARPRIFKTPLSPGLPTAKRFEGCAPPQPSNHTVALQISFSWPWRDTTGRRPCLRGPLFTSRQ